MVLFNNEDLESLIETGKHYIREDYHRYLQGEPVGNIGNIKGNTRYKIGIIMPNYNNAKWLEKSIGSIAKQTYKNYELIFIDDMSEDNSVEIAKKYIDKIPIKIVELKQKRYNGGARNEGYLYLSKDVDYVYYLDSDDWYADISVLAKINENLQGNPDVLFVGIGADYNGIMRCFYKQNYEDRYQAILGWSGAYGKVIKKELAVKCLFPEGTLKEDRTQHYKVCINMRNYRCLEDILYIWNRNNISSVTTARGIKWRSDTIRNWADSIEIYETYKGHDNKLDQILLQRIDNCRQEVENKGDEQR